MPETAGTWERPEAGTGPNGRGGGFLGVEEAAERAGVTPRAIRKACAEGRLAGRQLGSRWLVDADDLARYAERLAARSAGSSRNVPGGTERAVPDRVPAAMYAALLARHEVALVRLGQAEAEAEHLRSRLRLLEAGEQEDHHHLGGKVATSEPEPEVVDEQQHLPEPGTTVPPEAPRRAPWWAPWRRTGAPAS